MVQAVSILVGAAAVLVILSNRGCLAACDAADIGWPAFGTDCQYMCHCVNDAQCHETTGACGDEGCHPAWFGPACQYEVSQYTTEGGLTWINDTTSCNSDASVQSVTLTLVTPHPLTWIRVVVSESAVFDGIALSYKNDTGEDIMCDNEQRAKVDDLTMDISCPATSDETVAKIILSGSGVVDLCTVYISGGRNVALLAADYTVNQSSTADGGWEAENAVDGLAPTGDDDWTERSLGCAQAERKTGPFWWEIRFGNRSFYASKFVIFNKRGGDGNYHLVGFTLLASDSEGGQVFLYTDDPGNDTSGEDIYTVVPGEMIMSINTVRVDSAIDSTVVFHICEVLIYGDSICEAGKYGRECENSCNCADQDEACFVSTGGCPSGCAAGYTGEDCQTLCSAGFYDFDCAEQCSINCADDNNQCNHVDGSCDQGCVIGYQPPVCKQICEEGKYGQDCMQNCSTHCYNVNGNTCDHIDGKCDDGCDDGYQPPQCDQECADGYFGQGCESTCGSKCVSVDGGRLCDFVSGHCSLCEPGYKGQFCEQECDEGTYGQNCSQICSSHCSGANGNTCDHIGGSCDDGCEPGYIPPLCLEAVCDATGWPSFGEYCQYMCHCVNDVQCDETTGACPDGRCDPEWFGPACQYESSSYTIDGASDWLPGDTCDTMASVQSVTLSLDTAQPLTWIRVVVNHSAAFDEIAISYNDKNGGEITCGNEQRANVDDLTMDISCPATSNETVAKITLSGSGVVGLCTVYISGGRNIALLAPGYFVTQTSTLPLDPGVSGWEADNGIDGLTPNGAWEDRKDGCTKTDLDDNSDPITWDLFFGDRSFHVNKFVIINRRQDNQNFRLAGFTLRALNATDGDVFPPYVESSGVIDGKNIYTVVPETRLSPVNKIVLAKSAGDIGTGYNILEFCEMFIYGDSICEAGKYGRECENSCNCADQDEACFVSTGGCPFGCAPGYTGEDCHTQCPSGMFGQDCASMCNATCVSTDGRPCDFVSGHCSQCVPGYMGHFCDQECSEGTYGQDCQQFCSSNCDGANNACDHVDGSCDTGCVDGYNPPLCLEERVGGGSSGGGAVVPAVIVSVLLVLIIAAAVAVFIWRRRRGKHVEDEAPEIDTDSTTDRSQKSFDTPEPEEISEDHYVNMVLPVNTAVPVKDLRAYIIKHLDDAHVEDQFKSIPLETGNARKIGAFAQNSKKNRFKNIVPYDATRVVLKGDKQKLQGDYINASHVKGYDGSKSFIASQAPNEGMMNDFMRLLWEQKIERIVMLTSLVEQGKKKCSMYWPTQGEETFGEVSLKLINTKVFAEYTIRHLQISKGGKARRDLIQFHYTAWPDKLVPESPWGLVDLYHRVMADRGRAPILVHCSAGVGRTGTFIALCHVLQEAAKTGQMDFLSTLVRLRHERMHMIQTMDQYKFLHRAALVAYLTSGTNVKATDLAGKLKSLQANDGFSKEFQLLSETSMDELIEAKGKPEDEEECVYNNRQVINKSKNRLSNILPKEAYQVSLMDDAVSGDIYINAVLVPNLRRNRHDILTQLPLPTTITDFWRMINEYRARLIVAFQTETRDVDDTIGAFLPSGPGQKYADSEFELTMEVKQDAVLWKELSLTLTKHNAAHSKWNTPKRVSCLLVKSFEMKSVPLYELVKKIKSLQASDSACTVFTCRNGASLCGLACVQSVLVDKLKADGCVAVPLVVGAVKVIRPQVIPSVDQYKLLYEVLHLEQQASADDVYGNINEGYTVDIPSSSTNKPATADLPAQQHQGDNTYSNCCFEPAVCDTPPIISATAPPKNKRSVKTAHENNTVDSDTQHSQTQVKPNATSSPVIHGQTSNEANSTDYGKAKDTASTATTHGKTNNAELTASTTPSLTTATSPPPSTTQTHGDVYGNMSEVNQSPDAANIEAVHVDLPEATSVWDNPYSNVEFA